jgi:hypothetical protein
MYGKIESQANNEGASQRWYNAKESELASQVLGHIRYLDNTQSDNASEYLKFMRMYADMPALNVGSRNKNFAEWAKAPRLTLNVVKSIIDYAPLSCRCI